MRPPWSQKVDYTQKPIFICWETTKSCLLSCRHCRARAIRHRAPEELDTLMGKQLIDQILDFGEPYPALLLTGGDPLMRPDWDELAQHAVSRGIYTAVAASVTPLIAREKFERMKAIGVEITSVSLDGASAEIHDRIRDVPGTFDATLGAIEMASSCGLRMQVNSTVMRSNLDDLADMFHLVRTRGAVAWEVFFLIRTGRGSDLENPSAAECEEVAHFLVDASAYGIPVRTSEGPHFRRVFIQRQGGSAAPRGGLYERLAARLRDLEGEPPGPPTLRLNATGDGKGILFISHDGEVYPSGFFPLSLGNVREARLQVIYTTHPELVALRDPSRLKGRCGACEHRVICGGSRSRAYAELHDPLQEDPACPYVPAGFAPVHTPG